MQLRPYQLEAVDVLWSGIRTKQRQLCALPTASGKGEILRVILERALSFNARSLLLLNRETLISQFVSRLKNMHPSVYAASAGLKELDGIVTVASIQSCHRAQFQDLRLIIIDEAHNVGTEDGMYERFLNAHPEAKIIGFTATPFNERGYIYGQGKPFPSVTYRRTMEQMINDGWIVKPVSKCPPHKLDVSGLRVRAGEYVQSDIDNLLTDRKVEDQVKDALSRMTDRRKIVWACASIKHAERVRSEIGKYEDAAILHSKQSDYEKELNRRVFEQGAYRHMVTVMMLSEGYDYAPIDCVVMLRPTRSAKLYVQVCGRALRLSEGKSNALILDYGSVIENLGPLSNPIVSHGAKKGEKVLDIDIKLCPMCFSVAQLATKECDCGYVWPMRDVGKSLLRKAADIDILNEPPRVYNVEDIEFKQHKAKSSGNDCVRIVYWTGLTNVSEYFSNHPFSFNKCKDRIEYLTGFKMQSFKEAWDACTVLMADGTFEVETKRDGKYTKIQRVSRRVCDIEIPF